jgi:ATP/maltotriose-dependent transcriptional regulator MalT
MLFRQREKPQWGAGCLSTLADIAIMRGDLASARELAEESVALRRELGSVGLGRGLASVAEVAIAEGDLAEAQAALEEALAWQRTEAPDSQHLTSLVRTLGVVALRRGDFDAACEAFDESLRHAAQHRDEPQVVACIEVIASLVSARGDSELASGLAGWAEQAREAAGFARSRPELPLPEHEEPAWSEGRAMSLDDAVEYALASLD